MDTGFESIYNATVACHETFRETLRLPRLMKGEWGENRLADFNLWASGAGATARGKSCLDARLRHDVDGYNLLVNLLQMLGVLVRKCIEEAHLNHDKPGKEIKLSAGEFNAMKDVEEVLNQLTRLTLTIRKAGSSSRLRKADASFDPGRPQMKALRQHLELLLLARPREYGSWQAQISEDGLSLIPTVMSVSGHKEIHAEQLTVIQTRLIEANLRRRNRFLYAQRHSEKLAESRAVSSTTKPEMLVESQRSALVRTEARSSPGEVQAVHMEANLGSATTASIIENPIILPAKPDAQPASTVISTTSAKVEYPKAPPGNGGLNVFKCPCCCQSLPTRFGKGSQWKKHLASDILPYTCIIANCPHPDEFYVTRKSWLDHMNKEHGGRRCWICLACKNCNIRPSFDTEADFAFHLKQTHERGIKAQQIPMLISAWSRTVPLQFQSCPLCNYQDENQSMVVDHTAEHIHSFSLKALPWGPGSTELGLKDIWNYDQYFERNRYFDNTSESGSSQTIVSASSEALDFEQLPVLDFENAGSSKYSELTEEAIQHVPLASTEEIGSQKWLEAVISPTGNPVFGVSISDPYARSGILVPAIVSECIQAVEFFGLDVEGIYLLSEQRAQDISLLYLHVDDGSNNMDFRNPESFYHDIHNVAALLKQFFRALPDPLVPTRHSFRFIDAALIGHAVQRRDALRRIIIDLPVPNFATLKVLALHLERVMEHRAQNGITRRSLATCFGPILMGISRNAIVADQERVVEMILLHTFEIFDYEDWQEEPRSRKRDTTRTTY